MSGEDQEARLRREALRLNERFLTEVVEAWDLCPWSRPARARGEVAREVWTGPLSGEDAVPEGIVTWVREIAASPHLAVALLICPRGPEEPEAWLRVAETLRTSALEAPGQARLLAVAPFHPRLPWSAARPASLVPLFRRSPDPTLQLVRLEVLRGLDAKGDGVDRYAGPDALERLLRGELPPPRPSVSERVAAANAARLEDAGGAAALLATLDAIHADRAQTYARLAAGEGMP